MFKTLQDSLKYYSQYFLSPKVKLIKTITKVQIINNINSLEIINSTLKNNWIEFIKQSNYEISKLKEICDALTSLNTINNTLTQNNQDKLNKIIFNILLNLHLERPKSHYDLIGYYLGKLNFVLLVFKDINIQILDTLLSTKDYQDFLTELNSLYTILLVFKRLNIEDSNLKLEVFTQILKLNIPVTLIRIVENFLSKNEIKDSQSVISSVFLNNYNAFNIPLGQLTSDAPIIAKIIELNPELSIKLNPGLSRNTRKSTTLQHNIQKVFDKENNSINLDYFFVYFIKYLAQNADLKYDEDEAFVSQYKTPFIIKDKDSNILNTICDKFNKYCNKYCNVTLDEITFEEDISHYTQKIFFIEYLKNEANNYFAVIDNSIIINSSELKLTNYPVIIVGNQINTENIAIFDDFYETLLKNKVLYDQLPENTTLNNFRKHFKIFIDNYKNVDSFKMLKRYTDESALLNTNTLFGFLSKKVTYFNFELRKKQTIAQTQASILKIFLEWYNFNPEIDPIHIPPNENLILYSGGTLLYDRLGKPVIGLEQDTSIILSTFLSTSLNPAVCTDFLKECLYKIEVCPKDQKYLMLLEGITTLEGEFEVLLPTGTKLQLQNIKKIKLKNKYNSYEEYIWVIEFLLQVDIFLIENFSKFFESLSDEQLGGSRKCTASCSKRKINKDNGNICSYITESDFNQNFLLNKLSVQQPMSSINSKPLPVQQSVGKNQKAEAALAQQAKTAAIKHAATLSIASNGAAGGTKRVSKNTKSLLNKKVRKGSYEYMTTKQLIEQNYKKLLDKNKNPIKRKLLNRIRQIYIDGTRRHYIKVNGEYVLVKSLKIQKGGDIDIIISNNNTVNELKLETGSSTFKIVTRPDGSKYFLKTRDPSEDEDEDEDFALKFALNEVLACSIYRNVYGMENTLNTYITKYNDTFYVASKYIKDINIDYNILPDKVEKFKKDILHGFFVDCIMANWDLAEYGNIALIDNSSYVRMDLGGTMMYRAQGGKRNFEKINNINDKNLEFMTYTTKSLKLPIYEIYKNLTGPDIDNAFAKINIVIDWNTFKNNFINDVKKLTIDENIIENIIKTIEIVRSRHDFYILNSTEISDKIKQKFLPNLGKNSKKCA
jgi:hypothetical protein